MHEVGGSSPFVSTKKKRILVGCVSFVVTVKAKRLSFLNLFFIKRKIEKRKNRFSIFGATYTTLVELLIEF